MPRSVDKFPEKRGAGGASLHNPLRSQLDWQSALSDTTQQAGDRIRGVIAGALDQVIEVIYEETGLDLTVLSEIITSLPGGGDPMAELGAFFDALRAFLPFDLNAPGFDPAAAAVAFIQNQLTPQGLLAELTGGKLKAGQEPQLLLNLKDAVGGGLNSTIVAIENRLQFLNASGQFPAAQLFGSIAASLISGVLAAAQIPLLDASKIGSGTFGTGLIPDLDAGKIITGTFGVGRIPNLPADQITSGTLLSSLIPGLDASKIVSGSLGDGMVPGLGLIRDAIGQAIDGGSATGYTPAQIKAKLQAFPGANIAGSIAASLLTGTLGAGQIPGLDASKIVSGQFGTSVIPDLDAAKIISGTLGLARIPGLDASKIISGTFGAALIPGLDASKIVSGTLSQSMVANLVSDLAGKAAASAVQNSLNAIWQGFGGSGTATDANLQTVTANYQTRITALEGGGTLTRFGSNGTWTNPTPTEHKKILVRIYNGGQGGAKLASATPGSSNGGLGGGCVEKEFYTDEIASSVGITVGSGTAGGPAGSSASNPSLGGTSQFGSLLSGAADTGDLNLKPGKGGDGSYTGSSTSATPAEWGEGNKYVARAAKGTTGAGAAGGNSPSGIACGGAGGGGGGSNTSPAGFNGGNGGAPGGGGGGAGKGINATSGAGGNGAAGAVDVITY